MLIMGLTDSSPQNASISISVSQQVIVGVFVYYYVLIGLVSVVAVVIVIGIGVFIYRQRMRRRAQLMVPAEIAPLTNDIEHFNNFMPVFPAEQLGSEKMVCSICLMHMERSDVIRQTPCGHSFHSGCIDSWCLKNLSCPVCRTDLSLLAMGADRRGRGAEQPDWSEEQENSVESGAEGKQKREDESAREMLSLSDPSVVEKRSVEKPKPE
jgi:hypothetical protein